MTIEPEYDYEDMAKVHLLIAYDKEVRRLIIAARRAFDSLSLPDEEQKELDAALEAFSQLVTYDEDG